jgi:hypothetical protein
MTTAHGTTTGRMAVYLHDIAQPDINPTNIHEPPDFKFQHRETAQTDPIMAAHRGPST